MNVPRGPAAAVVVLAIAVRVAAILVLQSHHVPRSTFEHGEIAENLLAGRGFSVQFLGADGPTSQQAPIYPFVVAGAYALGGVGSPTALLVLQVGQAILGGILAAGAMALAREATPGRKLVAIVAGLVAALHPTLVYSATHVQVAALASTLLVWSLALGFRSGRTGRAIDGVLCGGVLALLILTDPILGLAAPGIAWAVALGRLPTWRRTAFRIALTAILGVSPWIARNYAVHGEIVFVKSTFGYAFWQGNCRQSEGTDKVVRPSVDRALSSGGTSLREQNRALWEARHEAGYLDDIALTRADYDRMARMTEPARSRFLFRRAMADLRADPWRYPRLCLRRLRFFVLFDETNPKTRSRIYRGGHLGLTVLAGLGLLLMPSALRRRLGPTLLTAGLIAGFHSLTIVSARFHVPIEPLMGVWAASGLARLRGSIAEGDGVEGLGELRRLAGRGSALVGRGA